MDMEQLERQALTVSCQDDMEIIGVTKTRPSLVVIWLSKRVPTILYIR